MNLLMEKLIQQQIAAAFTEWERHYREEPERFQSEATKLLNETPESYGARIRFRSTENEMR